MQEKLGKKIAEGACAEVYEWENETKIVKLAKPNTSYEAIRREYNNSRLVFKHGISIPEPIELVEFDGKYGIVFERIYGKSLLQLFIEKLYQSCNTNEKKDSEETQMTARVLADIHKTAISGLPSQRENIVYSINSISYLTAEEKAITINYLYNLPQKNQLCHGDPNPNNIMVIGDKTVLIDWNDASCGNPEADLAEYVLMMRYAVLPGEVPKEVVDYLDRFREDVVKEFVDEYSKHSNVTYKDIDKWLLPIAARKLSSSGICEEEKNILLAEIRRRLKNI